MWISAHTTGRRQADRIPPMAANCVPRKQAVHEWRKRTADAPAARVAPVPGIQGAPMARTSAARLPRARAVPMRCRRLAQLGQGMTEYVVVVALVAVAAIAVYQLFGQVVRAQTAAMARELAGENGAEASKKASAAAAKTRSQLKEKTLKSFTGNAAAGAAQ